jgi:hypothetical protein
MKKYIFTALMLFAANASFSQSKTVSESQFANTPQQWENEMVTLQNVDVSFEAASPQLKAKCKAPKSFEIVNVKFKGSKPDFQPCFIISHQMKLMMIQKAGGETGKFDITFKGSESAGYLIQFMVHKGN